MNIVQGIGFHLLLFQNRVIEFLDIRMPNLYQLSLSKGISYEMIVHVDVVAFGGWLQIVLLANVSVIQIIQSKLRCFVWIQSLLIFSLQFFLSFS